MKKPEFDVYEASTVLAWALDTKDWQKVEEVFRKMLDHKKAVRTWCISKK